MANGRTVPGGAPTYDRLGIDQATADSKSIEHRDRVVAALRLGWELQELVARSYFLGDPLPIAPALNVPDPHDQPCGAPSLFLPDLFHAQSPDDRLQSVITIVKAQPAMMFPSQPVAAPLAAAQPPGGRPPGASLGGALQDAESRVGSQVAAGLQAAAALAAAAVESELQGGQAQPPARTDPPAGAAPAAPARDLIQVLTDQVGKLPARAAAGADVATAIAAVAANIDQAVVSILLDPDVTGQTTGQPDPLAGVLLSGYELGKALSGTRWMIWAAHMLTPLQRPAEPPPDPERVKDAWARMFDSGRLGNIQRHLGNVAPVYGGRVMMAVSKSLDYWRAALLDDTILNMAVSATPSRDQRSTHPRSEWAHGVWTRKPAEVKLRVTKDNIEQELILFGALCQQVDAWYDLLTLRRSPESFPVTGLVSNLLRQLASQELAAAGNVLKPFLRGAGLGLAILVAVVIALLAIAMASLGPGISQQVAAGGVLALGSGVLGSVAALLTRQQVPSRSAGPEVTDLQQRSARLESQIQQRLSTVEREGQAAASAAQSDAAHAEAAVKPLLPAQFSWQTIVQTAANDVVNQLKLEEIYLGVSEPLVRYVLSPEADKGGQVVSDPGAAAKRFLSLIYESTPNIERLGMVFLDLYRASGTTGASAPPPQQPGL